MDFNELNSVLLLHLISVLPNGSPSRPIPELPITPIATLSIPERCVNILWFTSLCLSLATALLAMVCKQWLYQYVSVTPGTPRERARIRHFRYVGLQKWKVPVIIDMLPFIMHLALCLFLAGLVLFLIPMHTELSLITGVIAGTAYSLYLVSVVIPLQSPECPYKTPLTIYIYSLSNILGTTLASLLHGLVSHVRAIVGFRTQGKLEPLIAKSKPARSLREAELSAVENQAEQLDMGAISWLYGSSNATARDIAVLAISGLQASHEWVKSSSVPNSFSSLSAGGMGTGLPLTVVELNPKLRKAADRGDYAKLECLLRVRLQLRSPWVGQDVRPFLQSMDGSIFGRNEHIQVLRYLSSFEADMDPDALVPNSHNDFPIQGDNGGLSGTETLLSLLTGSQSHLHQHPFVWMYLLDRYPLQPSLRDVQLITVLVEQLHEGGLFSGYTYSRDSVELFSVTLLQAIAGSVERVFHRLCRVFGVGLERLERDGYVNWTVTISPFDQSLLLEAMIEWVLEVGEELTTADALSLQHLLGTLVRYAVGMLEWTSDLADPHLPIRLLESRRFLDNRITGWKIRAFTIGLLSRQSESQMLEMSPQALRNVLNLLHDPTPDVEADHYYDFCEGVCHHLASNTYWHTPEMLQVFRDDDGLGALDDKPPPETLDKAFYFTAQRLTFSRSKAVFSYFLATSLKSLDKSIWFDFIHSPYNMSIICKSLILLGHEDRLDSFAKIDPHNSSWREGFLLLLGLFHDVYFLERMQNYRDRLTCRRMTTFNALQMESPVENLSVILSNLREMLQLTGSEFDMPTPTYITSRTRYAPCTKPPFLSNVHSCRDIRVAGLERTSHDLVLDFSTIASTVSDDEPSFSTPFPRTLMLGRSGGKVESVV